MQIITLLIACIGAILILYLKPIHGLIVYFVGLTWYPQPITISIASIDFSLGRVLILAVFIKIISQTNLSKEFKWNILDTFVMLFFTLKLISLSQVVPYNIFLVREGGNFLDTIIIYFCVRLIITTKNDLLTFIRLVVVFSIPIAVLGIYQSFTGHDPLSFLRKYYSWGLATDSFSMLKRHGFYRASSTFGHYGTYCLYFAAISIISLSISKYHIWSKKKQIIYFVITIFGALSSMSSAPLFSIVISLFLIACFPFRKLWPVIVTSFLIIIIFIEFYSNRHWYEVLTRFAFSSSTAYYRIGLIEEAFGGGMDGHWFFGYGYVGIGAGTDNTYFNWQYQDMVNIYIANLARFGLFGALPFIGMNFLYYRALYIAGKKIKNIEDLWLIWCIMATLGGWNGAMMTINALGQISTILYILIAICCNLSLDILNKGTYEELLLSK